MNNLYLIILPITAASPCTANILYRFSFCILGQLISARMGISQAVNQHASI